MWAIIFLQNKKDAKLISKVSKLENHTCAVIDHGKGYGIIKIPDGCERYGV